MTVAELIKELERCPKDLPVVFGPVVVAEDTLMPVGFVIHDYGEGTTAQIVLVGD